jgi:hypothetical protein
MKWNTRGRIENCRYLIFYPKNKLEPDTIRQAAGEPQARPFPASPDALSPNKPSSAAAPSAGTIACKLDKMGSSPQQDGIRGADSIIRGKQ